MAKATFGSGCFWCTDAVFQTIQGVQNVQSGFMGGDPKRTSYEEVCEGDTQHAEVIQFEFDENTISYEELLLIFFKTHNPTTLNQQGADKGTQYRSVIFYHTDAQKIKAETMLQKLTEEKVFDKPIVTEIAPESQFFAAKMEHQNFYFKNPAKPYCQFVIQPKLSKFADEFLSYIKPELL